MRGILINTKSKAKNVESFKFIFFFNIINICTHSERGTEKTRQRYFRPQKVKPSSFSSAFILMAGFFAFIHNLFRIPLRTKPMSCYLLFEIKEIMQKRFLQANRIVEKSLVIAD